MPNPPHSSLRTISEQGPAGPASGDVSYRRNPAGSAGMLWLLRENVAKVPRFRALRFLPLALVLLLLAGPSFSQGAGDVVISELMYHPVDSPTPAESSSNSTTGGAGVIDLDGWCFIDGIGFCFGAGATIAAGEYLVLARTRSSSRRPTALRPTSELRRRARQRRRDASSWRTRVWLGRRRGGLRRRRSLAGDARRSGAFARADRSAETTTRRATGRPPRTPRVIPRARPTASPRRDFRPGSARFSTGASIRPPRSASPPSSRTPPVST